MKKKLALLMAVILVLTLLPFSVFAEERTEEKKQKIEVQETKEQDTAEQQTDDASAVTEEELTLAESEEIVTEAILAEGAELMAEDAASEEVDTQEISEEAKSGETALSSGPCGENVTYTLTGDTLTISGSGPMYDYDFSNRSPFYQNKEIKTVTIETGVTRIGAGALAECENITDVYIGSTVTSIGDNAFTHCSNLTNISIPAKVTSIGSQAFFKCSKLPSITIPSGVTKIEPHTFDYCFKLANVTIPEGVTSIGGGAFYQCVSLTNIKLPKSLTELGGNTFAYCTGLTEITIPYGVTSIGNYTFDNCTNLKSVTIPNSVTRIGEEAFVNCEELTDIIIPDSVTSIERAAFRNCKKLARIAIPDSVTTIDTFAFNYCSNLTIYGAAGSYAENHANERSIPFVASGNIDGFLGDSVYYTLKDGLLTVFGSGPMYDYSADTSPFFGNKWTIKQLSIQSGVTSVGEGAFYRCENLKSVTIADGVTSIGTQAFRECRDLAAIKIPNSVTSIGKRAFYFCYDLESVAIPNGVTSIGYEVFGGCLDLKKIIIPETVTSIDDNAFTSCSNLTIHGVKGSYAQYFANGHYIPFSTELFPDALEGYWYTEYVNDVYWKGIMTGLNDNEFGATQNLVRAQFAVILYRMSGEAKVAYKGNFPDVFGNEWYADAVAWASEYGIITGYTSTGCFGPADNITREQMAVMLYRYARHKGYDTSARADLSGFPDAWAVNSYAYDGCSWCVAKGIIGGKTIDGVLYLDPQGLAIRAECAKIISVFTDMYS